MKFAPHLFIAFSLLAGSALAATTPVPLKAQPGTSLDTTARKLVADELAQAGRKGDAPLVLVGEASLGGAGDKPAIFIQLQSERECGSAGCSTSVFMQRAGRYVLVLDSVGGSVGVDSARHAGQRDLIVGNDGRWIYNGTTYVDTRTAPDVRTPAKRAAVKPVARKPAPKAETPASDAPKADTPKTPPSPG